MLSGICDTKDRLTTKLILEALLASATSKTTTQCLKLEQELENQQIRLISTNIYESFLYQKNSSFCSEQRLLINSNIVLQITIQK